MTEKIILHIDMDAFFASVEQRDNPALRGKPIAVTGSGERTVVATSSYEARARGVRTGMNKFQARAVCPEIIFVRGDHHKYGQVSQELNRILYSFTPDLEAYSIDESFLDITGVQHLFGEPLNIGRKIKDEIYKNLKLKCSVGIGPNKLLAKLASSHHKPDGLFWIKEKMAAPTLKNLPVEELWGIGNKTKEALNKIGIYTCAELARTSSELLKRKFGILGGHLKEMAQGRYDAHVMPFDYTVDPKSIGHSMTLPHDITAQEEILKHILELSDMVSRRLRQEGFLSKTVTVTIRYNDFFTFSRQKKTLEATDDTRRIYTIAANIVKGIALEKPIRLLGVSVSGLEKNRGELFLFEEDKKQKRLNKTLDSVNERFGDGALTFAAIKNSLQN